MWRDLFIYLVFHCLTVNSCVRHTRAASVHERADARARPNHQKAAIFPSTRDRSRTPHIRRTRGRARPGTMPPWPILLVPFRALDLNASYWLFFLYFPPPPAPSDYYCTVDTTVRMTEKLLAVVYVPAYRYIYMYSVIQGVFFKRRAKTFSYHASFGARIKFFSL